ncbi:hypothetical protein D3C72_1324280 [compost metagenome]
MVSLNVVFPLAVTGQLVIDLRFAFKTEADISLVAVFGFIIAENMFGRYTTIEVEFIAIFIINFCRVGKGGHCP